MTDTVRVLFALGLPWLTGALFVMAVWRSRAPGYWPIVLGMGFPLGLTAVISVYMLLGYWGPGLDFRLNVLSQLILALVFAIFAWWRWRFRLDHLPVAISGDSWGRLSTGWRLLVTAILAWLVVRWLGILVEVVHRPLFPWDAWYAYGLNAKVWFYYPQLDAFANGWQWLEAEQPVWASGGTRHPPGIGLIQLWFLQALGRFDDALMNLAWPFGLISLGLMLFGLLRYSGSCPVISIVIAAIALTLPLLNTQTVLAGYGDFWIAVLFLMAVGSAFLARTSQPLLLVITFVSAMGMLLLKETSLLWCAVLVPGIIFGWVRMRWILIMSAAFILIVIGILYSMEATVRVGTLGRIGFTENGFEFPRYIGIKQWQEIRMWPDLLKHMLVYGNWHLFWYFALLIMPASLWFVRFNHGLRIVSFVVCSGFILLLAFFSFTKLGTSVVEGTSVNRLLLHLVPSICFLGGLTLAYLSSLCLRENHLEEAGAD